MPDSLTYKLLFISFMQNFLGITIDTKNLVEITAGIFGILGLSISAIVHFTTLTIIARFQRLIDRNKVLAGQLDMRLSDLEKFNSVKHGFNIRPPFPEQYLPDQNTQL